MEQCLKCGTYARLDADNVCHACEKVYQRDAAALVGSKECHRCGKELNDLAMQVRGEIICEKCQTAADFII